jgi:hypothetical protein
MRTIAIILGTALAVFPTISYLTELQYRADSRLERSVCRSLICSEELLIESADRLAGRSSPDQGLTIPNLQEALRRNPASPKRWSDLGEALLAAGRIEEARYCFSRAVELGPQSPPAFWRAALFHSQINEANRSHQYLGKMLELVPQYQELVFERYVSSKTPIPDILKYGIPRQAALAQDFFRYLLNHDAPLRDIKTVWEWSENEALTDDSLTAVYTDFLLMKREYAAAVEIWKRGPGRQDETFRKPNVIFNGGFELQPIESGLDWRLPITQGARINRDSSAVHSGFSALHIEFDGKDNIDFNSVTQAVVAEPGRYHFKAWLRTSELSTDQGIGFRVTDASGRLNLRSSSLVGTHDWTPIEMDFTLSGGVQLLRIEVVRQPSWKFDNKIHGGVWIDSVSLVRS